MVDDPYVCMRPKQVGLVIDRIHGAAAGLEAVNMSEILSKFANDMVCRAVAGRSFRVEGRDRIFRDLIAQAFDILGGINLESFYPGLANAAGGVLLWPALRKAERLRDRWSELLDKLIEQHSSGEGAGEDEQETDFIHVLLAVEEEYGLTRDNIRGILSVSISFILLRFSSMFACTCIGRQDMFIYTSALFARLGQQNMFAAGTDTTFLLLEFAMAELMLHQDVMAKLQAEVRKSPPNKGQTTVVIGEDDALVGTTTYLKAVIKETLRLHPPVPLLVPHLSQEDCDVDGYTIPSGMPLLVNAWAIGRDPRLWDAAEEFVPERFVRGGGGGGVDFRGMDFEFLPFGSGRRMCPGVNFALASTEILLANLVFHFDWELPRGVDTVDMAEVFKLTVSRKQELLLTPRAARGT
jgi:cytochrome P450